MRNSTVFKMQSVRQPEIEAALRSHGLAWTNVAHVTATNTLCAGIMNTNAIAIPITKLIDVILIPMYEHDNIPISHFPHASVFSQSRQHYRQQVEMWDRAVNARLITQRIALDDAMYGYYRSAQQNKSILKSMYDARSAFASTVYSLNASGVDPFEITPTTPEATIATDLWRYIEEKIPSLSHVRKNLWINCEDEYRHQKTNQAQQMRTSILDALNHIFGHVQGTRTIVHHGFYFYTPVQWALFNLLDETPGIEQIFVTHDRPESPVFEVWRKFFQEKWGFTKSQFFPSNETVTPGAIALLEAVTGISINAKALNEKVKLLECRNAPEFVVHVNYHAKLAEMNPEADAVEIPLLYAADSKTVNRFFDRLSGGAVSGNVNLAKLPIGSFLIRVHECIRVNRTDDIEYQLQSDAFRDIIASGFLISEGKSTDWLLPAVRRALPYFRRCRTLDEWIVRAKLLEKLIKEFVPHGQSTTHPARNAHVTKLQTKATNPLVLLEWLDISTTEATSLRVALEALRSLLQSIAQTERVSLGAYFNTLIAHLRQGMIALDSTDRKIIEEKIDGMNVSSSEEVYVVSLTDLVTMLVGRSVEFDSLGEQVQEDTRFRSIRSLDALGLTRTEYPLHIANLYDGVFPTRVRTIGWPFSDADLANAMELGAKQLLELGEQCTPMGDIYLLWLALNGTNADVTLSWMNELGGEHLNKSTLVELLAKPSLPTTMQHIVQKVGGVPIDHATRPSYGQPLFAAPIIDAATIPSITSAQTGLELLHNHVQSAYDVCERRLWLQWLVGVSPSYRPGHLQSMLYGNFSGISRRLNRWPHRDLPDVGIMYTAGQRRSAEVSASVKAEGPTASEDFVYTLIGRRNGEDRFSRGYQRAMGHSIPLAPINETQSFLPPKHENISNEICKNCPVLTVCAVAEYDDED